MGTLVVILLLVIIVNLVGGGGETAAGGDDAGGENGQQAQDSSEGQESGPVEAPAESSPEQPGSASSEQNTIPGDGTFIVGEDIQPGTYETEGSQSCYWERLSGTSGSFEDIITNGNPTGPTTLTISPSDTAFSTQGCSEWTFRSSPESSGDSGSSSGGALDQGTIPGDGTFIVGEDIQAGTYETEGSQSCYWERLSGTSGTMEDVITNGVPTGPATITISPSDTAFLTQGCSEWTLR